MAFLYCTGPALIYVGIPVQWTDILQFIFQTSELVANFPLEPVLVGSSNPPKFEVPFRPPDLPPHARIENNQIPPPIAIFIEQLRNFFFSVFLGTTEGTPTIEILPGWEGVETDAGGSKNPSERLSEGEEAIIRMDLTRYNEPVYEALAARSQTNAFLGRFPGFGQVGKAMALEGLTLPLWLVFPYTAKAVFGLTGQPPGYRFFQSILEGPDRLERLGSVPRLTGLQFRAQRLMQLIEDTSLLRQPIFNYDDDGIVFPDPLLLPIGQSFTTVIDNSIGGLYDFDTSNLPAPN